MKSPDIVKKVEGNAFKAICYISGFRRQKIDVPELRIDFKSRPLLKYWEVPDVFEAINVINNVFGREEKGEKEEMVGCCSHLRIKVLPSLIAHVILIDKSLDDCNYTYTRGHEYGHLLWRIEETAPIYKQAKNPNSLKKVVEDSEDFACLCGHIALYHKRIGHPSNWRGPKESIMKVEMMQKNFDKFFLG
jgi:hypothetical protein